MSRDHTLASGRSAFQRRAWGEAFRDLSAADAESPLDAADIECLADAAQLIGRDAAMLELVGRAHQAYLASGNPARAARCAYRLGQTLLFRNDMAQATGWLMRATRVLDENGLDCVERGFLLLPEAIRRTIAGDPEGAMASFNEAAGIGKRFGDADLITMARMGQGRALLRQGDPRGTALLDEAMVAVTAGEVSPTMVGAVYCSVIDGCYEVFDLRRAHEWTAALSAWVEAQPDLVPFRGDCLVKRAEVLQLHGEWDTALASAREAAERLSGPPLHPAAGTAFYRQAELHRLRGEFDLAKSLYLKASESGRAPEPGHALLRLAMGDVAQAAASIKRLATEARGRNRPPVLVALIEIALAAGDATLASEAAKELREIADQIGSPYLAAHADQGAGAVRLAWGDTRSALELLRRAADGWRDLGAPHELARTQLLLARALKAQGDVDAAELEVAAARRGFEMLGARPDLERMESETPAGGDKASSVLSPREIEVLSELATGRTNKGIAEALNISEKTVARHVANIFTKLNLPNRAAATAWAYENGLIMRTQL